MKFKDILFEYLMEQPDPNPEQELDPNAPAPEDTQEPEDTEQPEDNGEPVDGQPTPQNQPAKERTKSRTEIIKDRWRLDSPGIEEATIESGLRFFNGVKNNLQPLPTDPDARPQAEIASANTFFNAMDYPEHYGKLAGKPITDTFKDVSKLRDATMYTWRMIEFFIDRFSESEAREELDFSIDGDTPDIRKRSAIAKWEKTNNKIIDENGLVVFRVESKDESRMLGLLQHILVGEYGGNKWCITYLDSSNMYTTYRPYRSYYFVLDKTKNERDPNYISVLQPVKQDSSNFASYGPYVITPRPNGDQSRKTWDDVVSIWPQLRGKENIIKFFGETRKEKVEKELRSINFNKGDRENYFGFQTPQLQFAWIDNNNLIGDSEAFMMMRKDLQTEYVRRVTLENYKQRFLSSDNRKPFGMLQVLSKDDVKLLSTRLKEIGINDGINAIKASILKLNLNQSFGDIERPNIMMFSDKHRNGVFGVIDLTTLQWIKELDYVLGRVMTVFDPATREIFVLRSYTQQNGTDYFYLALPRENLKSKEVEKLRGRYLDGPEGDEFLKKYKRLGE